MKLYRELFALFNAQPLLPLMIRALQTAYDDSVETLAAARRSMAVRTALVLALLLALSASPSFAGSSGFSGGSEIVANLESLVNWLAGPVGRLIGMTAFIIGGAVWAFSRNQQGAKRFGQAVIGCALIVGAGNLADLFGFSSALM